MFKGFVGLAKQNIGTVSIVTVLVLLVLGAGISGLGIRKHFEIGSIHNESGTGGNTTSFASALINFTINTTGLSGNISEINITLPEGFIFISGSNFTNSTVGSNSFENFTNSTVGSVAGSGNRTISWFNSTTGWLINGTGTGNPGLGAVYYFTFNTTINGSAFINGQTRVHRFNLTYINVSEINGQTLNWTDLNFTVTDDVLPSLTSISINNTVTNRNETMNITIIVSDTNLNSSELAGAAGILIQNGTHNETFTAINQNSGDQFQINGTAAEFGCNFNETTCTLNITVIDLAGNTIQNQTTIYIDLDHPQVHNPQVNDTTVKQNASILINVTITDANLNVSNLTVGNVSRANVSLVSRGGNVYTVNTTPHALGCPTDATCTLTFIARDNTTNASHNNATVQLNLTVDDIKPSATASCDTALVTIGQSLTCTCTGSDSGSNIETTNGSAVDTSTAGTKTYTCTITDKAGNIATETVDYTVSLPGGSSSSSGGGGASSSALITTVTAGKQISTNIKKDGVNVKKITINPKASASGVKVEVTQTESKPSSVSLDPSGTVNAWLEIAISNLPNDKIESAEIEFEVTKQWLNDNEFEKENVVLQRLSGDWQKLETAIVSEDDDKITYKAETPGFSVFAITAEKAAEEPAEEPATPEEPSETVEEVVEELTPQIGMETAIIAVIIALVIIAVVAFVVVRRKNSAPTFIAKHGLIFIHKKQITI